MIGTNPYLVIRKTLGMGNATVQKLGVDILQLLTVFKLLDSIFDHDSESLIRQPISKKIVSLKTWLSFESSFDTIVLCFKFKVDVHHGGDLTGNPSLTQSFHDLNMTLNLDSQKCGSITYGIHILCLNLLPFSFKF